jgi:hypothetical protein
VRGSDKEGPAADLTDEDITQLRTMVEGDPPYGGVRNTIELTDARLALSIEYWVSDGRRTLSVGLTRQQIEATRRKFGLTEKAAVERLVKRTVTV